MSLKKFIALFIYVFAIATINLSYSKISKENPSEKVKFLVDIEQENCEAIIVLNIEIIDNWHINAANLPSESFSFPTQINLDSSINYNFDDVITEPVFEKKYDSAAKEFLYLHDGEISIKKKIKIISKENFILSGEFVFQTCDDKHCLEPYSEKFEIEVNGCNKEEINETSKESSSFPISFIYILGCFVLVVTILIFIRKK